MKQIVIYCEEKTPRLEYVVNHLAEKLNAVNFKIININDYTPNEQFAINYTNKELPGCYNLKPFGLLSERGIKKRWKAIFWDLDFFSFIFFCLSRYEEYLDFRADAHGRFPSNQSVFFSKDLTKPWVETKITAFISDLKAFGIQVSLKKEPISNLFTFDIDQIFKHKNLGPKRFILSSLNMLIQGQLKELRLRIGVQLGLQKDPYNLFDYLGKLFRNKEKPLFFWHVGKQGKYDNPNKWSLQIQNTIKTVAKWSRAGSHPSYKSSENLTSLELERNRFNELFKHPKKARQHYIKVKLPQNYLAYLRQGILEDYSMGFADDVGFRAGTCRPFYWYNLEEEKETPLRIFPFCAMDVSCKNYLKLSDHESLEVLSTLQKTCFAYGGTFIPIFHNQNLTKGTEWEPWRSILQTLVNKAYDS